MTQNQFFLENKNIEFNNQLYFKYLIYAFKWIQDRFKFVQIIKSSGQDGAKLRENKTDEKNLKLFISWACMLQLVKSVLIKAIMLMIMFLYESQPLLSEIGLN